MSSFKELTLNISIIVWYELLLIKLSRQCCYPQWWTKLRFIGGNILCLLHKILTDYWHKTKCWYNGYIDWHSFTYPVMCSRGGLGFLSFRQNEASWRISTKWVIIGSNNTPLPRSAPSIYNNHYCVFNNWTLVYKIQSHRNHVLGNVLENVVCQVQPLCPRILVYLFIYLSCVMGCQIWF